MAGGIPDLADPRFHVDGDPHAVWRHLRRTAPVSWLMTGDGLGYWSVTRHADVDRVLREHRTFTSERGTFLTVLGRDDPASGKQLAATDPPRHTAMRSPLHHALSISAPAQEDVVRGLIREALAPAIATGETNLAAVFAGLPVATLGTIMDVPRSDWPELTRLAQMAVAPDDPAWQLTAGAAVTLQRAHRALFAYFLDLMQDRRDEAASDLLSALLGLQVGGRPDAGAVVSNCYSLMVGAATWPYAPTAALVELAGSGRYASVAQAVLDRPTLLDPLVEEVVRWVSPASHFLRHTTTATELGGIALAAGDPVVVWLGSANRDDAVFADPDTFDPYRPPGRHVAFGVGPHNCLGAALARMMMRAALTEFFTAVADLEVTAAPTRVASTFVSGYSTAPVGLLARTGAAPRRTREDRP